MRVVMGSRTGSSRAAQTNYSILNAMAKDTYSLRLGARVKK